MFIRKAEVKDYETIYSVVKCAFDSAEHADGNEQDLVNTLRKGNAFIPELSLVAEMDGKIVGHIMFTKAMVGDKTVLALAPLSILPEYQRKGIGKALLVASLNALREEGYGYAIIGSVGPAVFYEKCVGAVPIEDSTPGIYSRMLDEIDNE